MVLVTMPSKNVYLSYCCLYVYIKDGNLCQNICIIHLPMHLVHLTVLTSPTEFYDLVSQHPSQFHSPSSMTNAFVCYSLEPNHEVVWKNSVVKKFETTRDKHADNQHVNHVGPLTTNDGTTIYDMGFNAKSTMPMKTYNGGSKVRKDAKTR